MEPTPSVLDGEDPIAGSVHRPHDLDAMLARVVGAASPRSSATTRDGHSTSPAGVLSRHRRVRSLAVVATVAALVAGVAAVAWPTSPGPGSAALLDIASQVQDGHLVQLDGVGGVVAPAQWMTGPTIFQERRPRTWHFAPGPTLSAHGTRGVGYRLVLFPSVEAATRHLSRVFGVTGDLTQQRGAWSVGSPIGQQLTYAVHDHLAFFAYASRTCELNVIDMYNVNDQPYSGCPRQPKHPLGVEEPQETDILTHGLIIKEAASWVRNLGLGYGISAPEYKLGLPSFFFEPKSTNRDYALCGHACIFERATFYLTLRGASTGWSVDFTFDQRGRLLEAAGPAFRVGAGTSYRLLSERAAVAVLDRTHPTQGLVAGPFPLIRCPNRHCHEARCPAKRCRVRLLPPWPVGHATLTEVSMASTIYVLKDGSLVGLPTYIFSGAIGGARGDSLVQGQWTQLAVVPSAVRFTTPAA